MVSRLTTHLYIGTIPPKIQKSDRLKEDFIGLLITISLSLVILLFLGFMIAIATGVNIINPFLLIFIIIITILMIFGIMFIILFITSIFLFKRGMDPNNFLISLVTSLADLLTPLFLLIFIQIFI